MTGSKFGSSPALRARRVLLPWLVMTLLALLVTLTAGDRMRRGIFDSWQGFKPRELAARVRSVLRRSRRPSQSPCFEYGPLRIDVRSRQVHLFDRHIELTAKEFDLLVHLAAAPMQIFSRKQLLAEVWQSSPEWQLESTVTEHVHRLRQPCHEARRCPSQIMEAPVLELGLRISLPNDRQHLSIEDRLGAAVTSDVPPTVRGEDIVADPDVWAGDPGERL